MAQNAQEFVLAAESILARVSAEKFREIRDDLMTQARSEFGDEIADEINDALRDTPNAAYLRAIA